MTIQKKYKIFLVDIFLSINNTLRKNPNITKDVLGFLQIEMLRL